MASVPECFIICLLVSFCSAERCCEEDAGEVRLVGGPNDFEGRVEVCLGGVWRRWCGSGVVDTEAAVVCRQLGHGAGGGVLDTAFHGVGDGSEFISSVSCPVNEVEIINCTYDNTTVMNCNDVAVVCKDATCTGTVEKPMLTNSSKGLVELCDGLDLRNGLCYEDFTMETAVVLCRQQGLNASNPDFVEVDDIHYFRTYHPHSCTGNEQQFSECNFSIALSQVCSSVRLDCEATNFNRINTTLTATVLTDTLSEVTLSVVVCILAAVVALMLIIGTTAFIIFFVRFKQEVSRLRESLREREHYFTTMNEVYDKVVPTDENIAYDTQPNTLPK